MNNCEAATLTTAVKQAAHRIGFDLVGVVPAVAPATTDAVRSVAVPEPIDPLWWNSFGDPLLTELVTRAMDSNLDLKIDDAQSLLKIIDPLSRLKKTHDMLNREIDLYMPLVLDRNRTSREDHALNVWARLKPGVPFEKARAEMATIGHRLTRDYPNTNSGWVQRGTWTVP